MLLRLGWAVVCVVVWPLYYLWLGVRWVIPYPLWPLSKAWAADDRLMQSFRSPPYLDRLRG
jgi:hypothetical protein